MVNNEDSNSGGSEIHSKKLDPLLFLLCRLAFRELVYGAHVLHALNSSHDRTVLRQQTPCRRFSVSYRDTTWQPIAGNRERESTQIHHRYRDNIDRTNSDMPKAPSSAFTNHTSLERLRKNDPTLTKLKLVQPHQDAYFSDNESFETFLQCLRDSTTVRYVLLERHFVRGLDVDQWIGVLRAIGQMTMVEEVEIWSVRVPLQELCEAFQHSTRLKRLGFGFVTLAGTLDASALAGHASLKNFYLSDFRLSEESGSLDSLCVALSRCPRLEHVEFFHYQQEASPFTPAGLAALMDSPSLDHLTLRRMGLTADSTSLLAHKLSTNPRLRVLNLNENQLENQGCGALSEALEANSTLQELDLRKNQLSAEGCFRLTQRLMTNTGLEKLNLASNPLEDLGAQGLALLLRVHPGLKTLELHRTQLTDESCACLVDMLRQNTGLLHLDLSFNEITEKTYLGLAEALKSNNTLKTINLQVNKKMKVEACEALLAMLKENTILEQINTLLRVRFEPQEYHRVEEVLHEMNLYLRLNHCGRHSLLQGTASLKDWGKSLLAVQDDLNGLYYLTQANPSAICDPFLQRLQRRGMQRQAAATVAVKADATAVVPTKAVVVV